MLASMVVIEMKDFGLRQEARNCAVVKKCG